MFQSIKPQSMIPTYQVSHRNPKISFVISLLFPSIIFPIDRHMLTTNNLRLRKLQRDDYNRGFLQVLAELTSVGEVSELKFQSTFDSLPNDTYVYVIEDVESGKVVAAATLLVEQKFIHQCGKVGHIEDVVVSSTYRGQNLGRVLVERLSELAKQEGCYKTILDCADHNVTFYEKCGLEVKGVEMGIYYH
ncbi:hypothetical protein RCL1_007827 [Eukaryota sp. TZLM3-RCL]